RIYAGQFFSSTPLALQVARNLTPSRDTSRTSCKSSVRSATLSSASRTACNSGKSLSSIRPLRAKIVEAFSSNRRIFNMQSYIAIRWPLVTLLRYIYLYDLRDHEIREITNFVNLGCERKEALVCLKPVFVDLQRFDFGIECGGRKAEFGSSAQRSGHTALGIGECRLHHPLFLRRRECGGRKAELGSSAQRSGHTALGIGECRLDHLLFLGRRDFEERPLSLFCLV